MYDYYLRNILHVLFLKTFLTFEKFKKYSTNEKLFEIL